MNSPIKKYLIGGVIVIAFAAYVIWNSTNNGGNGSGGGIPPLASNTPSSSVVADASATSSTAASTAPSGSGPGNNNGGTTGTPSGQYKDGTYTGSVADAFYGNLQTVAVIRNGQLADVQFPIYPNEPGHSTDVSQSDLPVLRQEAIAAQSANVNIVSGATQTSEAFQQSLAVALTQAK